MPHKRLQERVQQWQIRSGDTLSDAQLFVARMTIFRPTR